MSCHSPVAIVPLYDHNDIGAAASLYGDGAVSAVGVPSVDIGVRL